MSADAGEVRLAIDGPVASIVFDRPAAHNAMTWPMYERLASICAELAARRDVRVVTLRGAGGRAFVAGTDISQFAAFRAGADGVEAEVDAVRLPPPVHGGCCGLAEPVSASQWRAESESFPVRRSLNAAGRNEAPLASAQKK